MENGTSINEGLCLKCAKNLGLPQVNEMMQRMGITDEDLDNISNEMMSAFGGAENLEGIDAPDGDDEEDGKTATFPSPRPPFRRPERRHAPAPRGRRRPTARAVAARRQEDERRAPAEAQVSRQLLHQRSPTAPATGKLDACDRPRRGARARRPDPQPPPEEQPLPHRRAGRRQNGRSPRGLRSASPRATCPAALQGQGGLSARPHRARGGHAVPRPVREPHEGSHRRGASKLGNIILCHRRGAQPCRRGRRRGHA